MIRKTQVRKDNGMAIVLVDLRETSFKLIWPRIKIGSKVRQTRVATCLATAVKSIKRAQILLRSTLTRLHLIRTFSTIQPRNAPT